ncbi:DUF2779 domain-containing protein [Patescibacteria group bacterium]|nr:DUF2779 domain-containing protein [Patescibacteria group bacterium]
MKRLSKSRYINGLQCPKLLWLKTNAPEKIKEDDKAKQHMFEQGAIVEDFAKQLFPKGIDIQTEDYNKNLKQSKQLLKKRKPLFEAAFLKDNLYARADILNPVNKDEWDIIEVKSSAHVKDVHYDDVSFQKHVYEKAGLKIRKCFIMHINNEYVRKGKINPKKLLISEEITQEVNEAIKGIEDRIKIMFDIIKLKKCPKANVGPHCSKPYDCPVDCWDKLSDATVFDLRGGGKRQYELYDKGILLLEDIPEDYKLNTNQQIQRKCAKTKKPYIDKPKIKEFLKTLKKPLYYLDFETIGSAVPIFDNTRPYQHIPFQYSLHVVNHSVKHYSFLAADNKDPRLDLLKELKKVLGTKGSIVAYCAGFEKGVLKELAIAFPSYKKWVEGVLDRIVDLMEPFSKFYYYHPKQKGSASLKKVLPAFIGKDYSALDISEGMDASYSFMEIMFGDVSDSVKAKVREDLLKYCALDTEAMVWIVEKLEKIV